MSFATIVLVLLSLSLASVAAVAIRSKLARGRAAADEKRRAAAGKPAAAPREHAESPHAGERFVRFEVLAERGTRSVDLAEHDPAWRSAMGNVGARLRDGGVVAVVFAHGSFVGHDPLSTFAFVERTLPGQRRLTKSLRRHTRAYVERLLGDHGNFGPSYVRLFEQAIGGTTPCTSFVWSSENHHLGRLQGALGLVRSLATHAELGAPRGRILVLGHSHAGQVFALVTQLLSRSLASEAILDVARARSIDVGSLDVDLETLEAASLDFVTFGAPARYAWAHLPNVRSLHVVHGGESASISGRDWVRRFGAAGSDFPSPFANERLVNASLVPALGPGFAPGELVRSLRAAPPVPTHGDLVLVDYGRERLTDLVSSGLGHAVYTRLDGMLFHASLVSERLYRRAA
jgi:hypothetical protein